MEHLDNSCVWCWKLDTPKVDQRCLESSKIWCWGMVAEISWADHVKNEEILQWIADPGGRAV
jgi:hypothetical protein